MKEEKVKKMVREGYAKIAKKEKTSVGSLTSCCSDALTSCCSNTSEMSEEISKRIGYSEEEIDSVPAGANLGLGCGNPVAFASL